MSDLPPPLHNNDSDEGQRPPPLPDDTPSAGLPPLPGPPPLPGFLPGSAPPDMAENSSTSAGALPPPPTLLLMGTSGSLPPIPSNGNAMGIASLAIGTLSLPVGCFCGLMCFPFGILGLVMGIVGVCLSVIAMRQGSNYGERNVIAILGLLVSGLAVILTLIPLLFVAAAMIAAVLNP